MTKKKKKRYEAVKRTSSSSGQSTAKRPSNAMRIAAAVVIVAAIVAVAWFAKGAGQEGNQTQGAGGDSAQAASAKTAPAKDAGIWQLKVPSVDLRELKAEGVPIVIDFGFDDCIPCKQMAPVLADTNEAMQGKALVKFVDVWEHPEGADGFPIQTIPTQVLYAADGSPYIPTQGAMEALGIDLYSVPGRDGDEGFTIHMGALTQKQMDGLLADMGVK